MEAAEPDRRRHHQPPARPGALPFARTLGLLDIGKGYAAPAPGGERVPTSVKRHRARGPLQQPRAEALLQRRDQPGHPRRRQAELAGRRRKA